MHYHLETRVRECFSDFLETLAVNTRVVYRHAMELLMDFCQKPFLSITEDDITDFFVQLRQADSTKSVMFYCLRSFSVFLEHQVGDYHSPFLFLGFGMDAGKYTIDDFPVDDDIDFVIDCLGPDSDMALAVRFAYRMCLSVSEICSLIGSDFRPDGDGFVLLLQRTESAPRQKIQVPADLSFFIRQRTQRDAFLLNHRGRPMTPRNLQMNLKDTGSALTFRQLRNYGMLLLLRDGLSMLDVAEYAGISGRWLFRYKDLI